MQPASGTRVPFRALSERAAPCRPAPLPADLQADWDLAIRNQHNILLEGPPLDTEARLAELKPHLRGPLAEFRPADGARVPQPREGTLILREVARLDAVQQTMLLRWFDKLEKLQRFDERVRVRIVSTSPSPLFPLVGSGAFPSDLYYRLNVVRIELPDSEASVP